MFWLEFIVLFVAALLGNAAVLPYGMRLVPKDKPQKFSTPVLVLLSVVQSAVLFGIVIAVGLLVSHSLVHGAPYIEALLNDARPPSSVGLVVGCVLGIILGTLLLIADLFFLPYWPQALRETSLKTTLLENFLASFYGGINEELLIRLFGISGLVWLLSLALHAPTAIFWISNIVMTIIFGVGHLPSLKGVIGSLSPIMITRSLLLNAPIGLVCGWLFWTYGIETAILAHFFADIVYHVFGTLVLRDKLRTRSA